MMTMMTEMVEMVEMVRMVEKAENIELAQMNMIINMIIAMRNQMNLIGVIQIQAEDLRVNFCSPTFDSIVHGERVGPLDR